MSSAVVMMMVMMVGLAVCCSGGASTIVALVNEKIIAVDWLDWLLIPGWGKEKANADGTGGTTGGTSTNCIDTAIEKCKSGGTFTTLYTVDDHDTCVSTSKTECIAAGGSWTSAVGVYPKDCIAGSRVECITKRGNDRTKCTNEYKTKCVAAGGTWGSSEANTSTSKGMWFQANASPNIRPQTGLSPPTTNPKTMKELCDQYVQKCPPPPGRFGGPVFSGTKVKECDDRCMTTSAYQNFLASKDRIFGK